MQAKGTTIISLKDFVTQKHGQTGYQRWIDVLSPESKVIIKEPLLPTNWYHFEDALLKPMEAMGKLFYGGKTTGAWEQGRYTAETNLHGVYRVFVRVASPQFLIRNTAALWNSYYFGSQAKIVESDKSRAVLVLSEIEPVSIDYDHSVAGWIERALEICGCNQIKIAISNPEKGTTRYEMTWA